MTVSIIHIIGKPENFDPFQIKLKVNTNIHNEVQKDFPWSSKHFLIK